MTAPPAIVLAAFADAGLAEPVAEYRFHQRRRWRLDYAWPAAFVALEVEGGVWTRGRHTRPTGFLKDMEKYNTATALGWAVLRCTPQTILSDQTLSWLLMATLDVEVIDHTLGDEVPGPSAVRHGQAWRSVTRRMPL